MDPPTSSSFGIKLRNDNGPVASTPRTPKSKNANLYPTYSSPRPPFFCGNSPRSHAIPLQSRSRNVAKIIKGEIHNVLTVMRSDPRYYTSGSRFEYEERQQVSRLGFWTGSESGNDANSSYRMMKRLDDSSNNSLSTAMGSFAAHPILQGLRDLYDVLSSMESECYDRNADGDVNFQLDSKAFVSPFASAVCSPDVDTKTTGAALSALHKFIVYGFLESSEDVRESITVVAQCIRQCSFEETSQKVSSGGSKGSFWLSGANEQVKASPFMLTRPPSSPISEGDKQTTIEKLPQFLLQPRRRKASKGNSSKKPATNSSEDENVVLKLLSLSVQVLRCSAGRSFLSPSDVVGIFDRCLFISLSAEEDKYALLRSAAADALSHCVIVVFGMRSGSKENNQILTPRGRDSMPDDGTADPTTEDASDSADEWGDRDPSLDVEDSFLVKRLERTDSALVDHERSLSGGTCKPNKNQPNDRDEEQTPALVPIMARLAAIADPLLHQDDTCVLSLTLINIALETMNDVDSLASKYPSLLGTLQNDLCQNLLRLSTSRDLTLLGLAMRVIFNLFNCIKHHMKLQLEVFLTSVHLRMLTSSSTHGQVWSTSPEYRELALESLLEFCREPSLMMDLYLNYDCDINCTNLFETICLTLARVAIPDEDKAETQNDEEVKNTMDRNDSNEDALHKPRLNILNRLAVEGIIAVIDSISRRCRVSSKFPPFSIVGSLPDESSIKESSLSPPDSGNSGILGNTLCISKDSVYDTHSLSSSSDLTTPVRASYRNMRTNSDISDLDLEVLSKTGHPASLALRERKIRKRRIAQAATAFNESSRDKEWISELERIGVLPNPATPESVALFLYTTSEKLDNIKIGEYISKGPAEKYPFIERVLHEFTQLFDFSNTSFSESLRLFLSTFHLPGEAQCIDRLMEAFAKRLYDGRIMNNPDNHAEKTMLDPPKTGIESESNSRTGLVDPPTSDESTNILPFKSADAAFILAFSTIMLNTDLHNPNMDDSKRMTLEQFIRNNRGINDGSDLPIEFLSELYTEIKNNEIQVKSDKSYNDADYLGDLLFEKTNCAAPFFTANSKYIQAGVHERDMYLAISSVTTKAMATIYVQSWDDVLVIKALNGLISSASICAYFRLGQELDEIIDLLLSWGIDYVTSVSELMVGSADGEPVADDRDGMVDFPQIQAGLIFRDLPSLPAAFISSLRNNLDLISQSNVNDVVGSAAHRGLLSLHFALILLKNHLSIANESLPTLLEVIFTLRDVDALPDRLADLDDFADSKGAPLQPSSFSINSLSRVEKYKESVCKSPESASKPGFLSSVFNFGQVSSQGAPQGDRSTANPLIMVLRAVSSKASLDQIIMKMNDVNMAKRILSSMLATVLDDNTCLELSTDPLYEHNAVFVLELAARLLISNRGHSPELLPIFFSKFELLFSHQENDNEHSMLGLKFPYLLERIIVTILRAIIHLYDITDRNLRSHLLRSMQLITRIPRSYSKQICSRLGCGSAIVLRGCFHLFKSREEWSAIKNLLDMSAQHETGRPFVFDALASLIEYVYPVTEDGELSVSNNNELSPDGIEAVRYLLLKFLEGSYEDDLNYKLPSMMYMKRVLSKHNSISSDINSNGSMDLHPEKEWITMVNVIYKDICLSEIPKTAKRGFESLQEVLLSTKVDMISHDQWLMLMHMACKMPPDISVESSRIDSLNLIARLFLTLMPVLSNSKVNWAKLEDLTLEVAKMVGENLRSDRSSSLFEMTVHTVTNMCNVMSMTGFNGNGQGINFCSWVGETLLSELELVGASGGVDTSSVAAVAAVASTL